jgi:hypothetical protein
VAAQSRGERYRCAQYERRGSFGTLSLLRAPRFAQNSDRHSSANAIFPVVFAGSLSPRAGVLSQKIVFANLGQNYRSLTKPVHAPRLWESEMPNRASERRGYGSGWSEVRSPRSDFTARSDQIGDSSQG